MALSIKDRETEALARRLAERTGESITVATRRALEDRLRRLPDAPRKAELLESLEAIGRRLREAPECDSRSPEDIMGYDENGLPS